jgi:DNA-binding response OmpR family regulator
VSLAPQIIVVDDEPDLRALLEDYLGLQGFAVRCADGPAALDRALAERPADVIVLDVNMPGGSGFDALARLRAAGVAAGVIMLTARAEPADRITGLAGGADDYLVKPFEPRELLARIRAVLRRLPPPAAPAPADRRRPPVRMGTCSFDVEARRLLDASGAEVALTAMEFDLLSVLARHPRQTLSRSRLAELAHGRPLAPGDRSVDIRITRLRAKLGEDARAPRTLRTVHGEGYVFDPDT